MVEVVLALALTASLTANAFLAYLRHQSRTAQQEAIRMMNHYAQAARGKFSRQEAIVALFGSAYKAKVNRNESAIYIHDGTRYEAHLVGSDTLRIRRKDVDGS